MVVVGAGGSGSIFVTHLCRIWQAWTKLGGEPFRIAIFDPDTVSEANLARQCFCEADLGQNKALVLAQRMRAFYGIPVDGYAEKLRASSYGANTMHVGCVDNLAARRSILDASSHGKRSTYWLDLGNRSDSGQVILGGNGLPNFFDVFPEMRRARDKKSDGPSCSMAEALSKQDLFINSTLANFAGQLLWQLLRRGGLNHHGYFVNLGHGRVQPIEVPAP